MKKSIAISFLLIVIFFSTPAYYDFTEAIPPQDYWPTLEWETSTPKEQGMRTRPLKEMDNLLESIDWRFLVDSILIVKNGYIVYEYYRSESQRTTPHQIFSCTKVITSSLIGMCVDEGNISSLENHVVDYFQDYSFEDYAQKESITIRNLLTMTSGLEWTDNDDYYSMAYSSNPVEYVLNKTLISNPGSVWNYNSGGSHVLSNIIQNVSGSGTSQLAERSLFTPLGIEDYTWSTLSGVPNGATLLYLKTRDMAKIGFLYLNHGNWNGTQIVSETWVDTATSHLIDIQQYWYNGYGYQWWRFNSANCFGARGSNTQCIMVFPEDEMIIVSTGGGEFPFEWMVNEYILPATELYSYLPWIIGGISGVSSLGMGILLYYLIKRKKSNISR